MGPYIFNHVTTKKNEAPQGDYCEGIRGTYAQNFFDMNSTWRC
jgi:hypothetical protein